MRKGFTLMEILVAVIIVTILVTMAVPMYEKTIEKSRIAEARSMLKRIYDAKVRLMDELEVDKYIGQFGFENLDYTFECKGGHKDDPVSSHRTKCATKEFVYVINPTTDVSDPDYRYVCAARLGGDNENVNFLYGIESATGDVFMRCHDGGVSEGCEAFGMSSTGSTAWCNNAELVP